MADQPVRSFDALNQRLKAVTRAAERIYLTSFNARLAARGSDARGYERVTVELRRFSRDLAQSVTTLGEWIGAQLSAASELQRQQRFAVLVRAATTDSAAASGRRFRARSEAALEVLERKVEEGRRRLCGELQRTLRLCATGETLAVLARVEAGRDGRAGDARRLMRVADEIGGVVAQVEGLLKPALEGLERRRRAA